MAPKRGFFAEMQHQAALAEKQRKQAEAANERRRQALLREAERARAAADRAAATALKSEARAQAEAEREAKQLHVVAQEKLADSMNADLQTRLIDIDSILEFTLSIDDYVDLEKLRQVVQHPRFHSKHHQPIPLPEPLQARPEPVYVDPPAPKGVFGRKKKLKASRSAARADFETNHSAWRSEMADLPSAQFEQMTNHSIAEETRVRAFLADQAEYEAACRQRQQSVEASNAQLNALIDGLKVGNGRAIEEYVGIVLGNSVYPDGINVDAEYVIHEKTQELRMDLEIPNPESLPTARSYKYVKSKGEITESSQPLKEQRDRYTALLHQIALRTLHEIFEADHMVNITTISLTVGTNFIDPATGRDSFAPLLAVAVDRATFLELDLSRVTPSETLKHLGAQLSKNPHALTPIDTHLGVRMH